MTFQIDDLMGWIGEAADAFVCDDKSDEEVVASSLVAQGCHPDLANVIVDYLPSAFAEPVMEKLGASRVPTYERKLTNGRKAKYRWQDDEIWLSAQEFVKAQISNGDWPKYKDIALCSAELSMASDALNAGSDLKGGMYAVVPLSTLPPDSPFLSTPGPATD